jgi:hypothetical protein
MSLGTATRADPITFRPALPGLDKSLVNMLDSCGLQVFRHMLAGGPDGTLCTNPPLAAGLFWRDSQPVDEACGRAS